MSRLRANVLAARSRLAQGHDALEKRHQAGATGIDVCRAMSDLRDGVVLGLFRDAAEELDWGQSDLFEGGPALVAHGGYGRRDVAPYSDVDLMLLSSAASLREAGPLARRLLRDVFDAGMVLGHSVRTPEEACRLACQDAEICTSLVESRLLAGNERLFERFQRRFRSRVLGRAPALLSAMEKSRLEERIKYGETVFLLEPNVKRSRGGLRDIHFIRWVGFTRYGAQEPAELAAQGALSEDDAAAIGRAGEFLLWLRNELHFHARKPGDVLDRAEQVRIAQGLGYEAFGGMLPVESFMRDYFRNTDRVSHVASRFLAKARNAARTGSMVAAVFGHLAQGGFRVGPTQILATRQGRERIHRSLAGVMQLVDLANLYDKQIDADTWDLVRQSAAGLTETLSPESLAHFRSLLAHPTRLGELLRGLHETGLLEKFIPAFSHARGLLQFNQYHKYTVDEHSLRAVENAAGRAGDRGPLGRVYRRIAEKRVLHLALLIHDLGKGQPGDHCEVGLKIAEKTGERLGLEPHETEAVAFLVHKHLLMNHLAFRRDTGDEKLIVRFAVSVGSPELLEMLYVMTAADLEAVGPGAWTSWKAEILTDVYHRAMQYLAGETPALDLDEHLHERRQAVRCLLGDKRDEPWFVRQIDSLPTAYLSGTLPDQIAADLRRLAELEPGAVDARLDYQPETKTVEVSVATSEDVTSGVFHKLTGALTGQALEILSAQINTLAKGLVLDRFLVADPDYAGKPPQERLDQVRQALVNSLAASDQAAQPFRRVWRMGGRQSPALPVPETRVRTDNNTSEICTIIDIFAMDRPGLLYAVARTLFELDLSVWRAKIGTYLDQVVDVFYVTDQRGRKIEDEARLEGARRRLIEVIESLQS
jgi:[protein-PII] uridylyltransferase